MEEPPLLSYKALDLPVKKKNKALDLLAINGQ